jgi:hypothetical protein
MSVVTSLIHFCIVVDCIPFKNKSVEWRDLLIKIVLTGTNVSGILCEEASHLPHWRFLQPYMKHKDTMIIYGCFWRRCRPVTRSFTFWTLSTIHNSPPSCAQESAGISPLRPLPLWSLKEYKWKQIHQRRFTESVIVTCTLSQTTEQTAKLIYAFKYRKRNRKWWWWRFCMDRCLGWKVYLVCKRYIISKLFLSRNR